MQTNSTMQRSFAALGLMVMLLALAGCEPTGTTNATTARIQNMLPGTWHSEDQDMTISFTRSGNSTAFTPQHWDAATFTHVGNCTLMFQYSVQNYTDIYDKDQHPLPSGAYIRQFLTGYRGDCKLQLTNMPRTTYDKIDIADSDHISLGADPIAFVRAM